MTLIGDMLDDDVRPNRLPDVEWLRAYLDGGSPAGEPLLLALGETWEGTPPRLLDALRNVPADTHGYQMSMYGLPLLRRLMKQYVRTSQGLPDDGSWELAVSWTGTRSAMRDFAVHLRGRRCTDESASVLVVAPAWDYAGLMEPLGFRMAYVETSAQDGFLPSESSIRRTAADLADLALVVVNAQHNPTGHNWRPEVVQALVDQAVDRGAAILVDDAYFGLCPPDAPATSATAILLETLAARGADVPWLSVRSFGKQFHCNGWGVGAVLAAPGFLDDLVNELRPQHTYNYGVHLQYAMAQWLADGPAVEEYLSRENATLARKRAAVVQALGAAGAGRVVAGPAAPYILFEVPEKYADAEREYLRRCGLDAGVFLSPSWPVAREAKQSGSGFARMYLGPELPLLLEAVERLRKAQLVQRH